MYRRRRSTLNNIFLDVRAKTHTHTCNIHTRNIHFALLYIGARLINQQSNSGAKSEKDAPRQRYEYSFRTIYFNMILRYYVYTELPVPASSVPRRRQTFELYYACIYTLACGRIRLTYIGTYTIMSCLFPAVGSCNTPRTPGSRASGRKANIALLLFFSCNITAVYVLTVENFKICNWNHNDYAVSLHYLCIVFYVDHNLRN